MNERGSILVVDDDAESLRVLAGILQPEGYHVRPANSGQLALASIAAQPPDLILLDIRMPGMDGYEICRRLKAAEATRNIPVIFQSAAADLADRLEGLRLGAVDYLSKPFQREELLARVKTHLELGRLRGDLEERVRERTAQLESEIAERKRAEDALRRLNRELRAISDCNLALMKAEDEQTLLNEVCRIICDGAGYRLAWVGYPEHDESKTLRMVAWGGLDEGYLENARITWDDTERGQGPGGTAIRTGRTAWTQDFATDPLAAPWRENALQRGYRSCICLPLKNEEAEVFGALGIYSSEPNAFTPDEIRLLEELGGDLAFGIQALRNRIEIKRAEGERKTNLHFFESMDRINRAIQGADNLDRLMSNVLDEVLAIFVCDRAFLEYPCDSQAASWTVPVERNRPEYPGVFALGLEMPMDAHVAESFRLLLDADGPVKFGPGTSNPLPEDVAERFNFKCFMSMAIYPKIGSPWQFGIHQCSHVRLWSTDEERLLQEIGRRLADGMTSLLIQRNLVESEARYRHLKNYLSNIIDSMPSILVGMDRNEIITQWNLQAEAATGIAAAEAVGQSVARVLPDYTYWIEALRGEIGQGRPAVMEKLLLERQGERRFYDLMLYPLVTNCVEGTVVRIEDVTEQARIQELMIQTEKMLSIGGMAAGMAHEINNPLGIITQAAQNIERRVSPDHPANQEAAGAVGMDLDILAAYFEQRRIPEFIASIREAAGRASRIISNMLHFTHRPNSAMQPTSLDVVMEQALELASNDYDLKKKYDFRSIEIVREYQPDLPEVPVTATEIEQVLLNLLKNAAQAMIANPPERKPRIVLRIRQEERYALVEVEDNGPGITEEVRHRVFEPFFTTKEPGVGTGLGLSVSYMIVTQNHKGLMEVVSSPGNGACFTVRLPLCGE